MTKPEEYRQLAAECLRAMRQATSPDSRMLYLSMAQAWANLAEQVAARDKVVSFAGRPDTKVG